VQLKSLEYVGVLTPSQVVVFCGEVQRCTFKCIQLTINKGGEMWLYFGHLVYGCGLVLFLN